MSLESPPLPSGIPRKRDYLNLVASPFFAEIEAKSNAFLSALRVGAKSYGRKWPWPIDPLHTWSRQWEYPYCISHLGEWKQRNRNDKQPHVVDLGCGLSFLPQYLSHQGWLVSCCDNDVRLESVLRRGAPDQIRQFSVMDLSSLGYKDDAFDAVVCLSVLEHLQVGDRGAVLSEMSRILRPGGQLILTFDMAMSSGEGEIDALGVLRLLNSLEAIFDVKLPETRAQVARLREDWRYFLTTDWIREMQPALLPWRKSIRSSLRSIVQLNRPAAPFRSLSVVCLDVSNPKPA